jgi:hypothetical protein
MANELYFIPILQKALQDPEPRQALGRAFERILVLGAQTSYRSGLENFRRFMEEVQSCRDLMKDDGVRELILEVVTDAAAFSRAQLDAAMQVIDSNPEWKSEYEQLRHQLAEEIPPTVQVYRGSQLIGELVFYEHSDSRSLGHITPGQYLLRLSTGMVLWEGQLTGRDLLWAEAFGPESLDLAAETAEVPEAPFREIELLDGEVILRVCVGIEDGKIDVEWIG